MTTAMTTACSRKISYEISPSHTTGGLLRIRVYRLGEPSTTVPTTSIAMAA